MCCAGFPCAFGLPSTAAAQGNQPMISELRVKVKVAHEFNDYRGENECVIKWVNKSDETPARGKKGSVSDLALENENTGGDFSPADDDLPWK